MKRSKDIILILSRDYKIKYTNVDKELANKFIEKLNIINNLYKIKPTDYIIDEYYIKLDEFTISEENYYIINIRCKKEDCIHCIKALIDRPTGLYNRNYLEQIKNNDSSSEFMDYYLILIDIDDLKSINDTYGHLNGDKAIEIVGESITNSIRKKDMGIRYGGDEFIIIIFDTEEKVVNKVVERIRKELNKKNEEEDMDVKVSIGIACGNYYTSLNGAIKAADEELYKEKNIKDKNKSDLKEKVYNLKWI